MAKTPKTAFNPSIKKEKKAKSIPLNYKDLNACWQIGLFDFNNEKWGKDSALGNISFSISSSLMELLCKHGDNDLYTSLDHISNKKPISFSDFYKKLKDDFNGQIPSEIVHQISIDISRSFFMDEIYPKLRDFEKKTWNEIEQETKGGEGGSKLHEIKIELLSKEAQQRLSELKIDDIDSLFSLRLDGTLRIFGIRKQNYLQILWVDQNHEVCPSKKKHT